MKSHSPIIHIVTTAFLLTAMTCASCSKHQPNATPEAPDTSEPAAEKAASRKKTEPEVPAKAQAEAKAAQAWGKLPLMFVENHGQVDEVVLYYLRGPRGTVFFTKDAVVYSLSEKRPSTRDERTGLKSPVPPQDTAKEGDTVKEEGTSGEPDKETEPVRGVVIRQNFIDANENVEIIGAKKLEGKVNIFRGSDPEKWKSGISTFGEIIYKDLWTGVNLIFKGEGGRLKYELIVHTGTSPSQIRWKYEGQDEVTIDKGQLTLVTALGNIREAKPYVYQEIDGKRKEIDGGFKLFDEATCGLNINDYDKAHDLVIDPLIISE